MTIDGEIDVEVTGTDASTGYVVTVDVVNGGGLGVVQTISWATAILMLIQTKMQHTNHSNTTWSLRCDGTENDFDLSGWLIGTTASNQIGGETAGKNLPPTENGHRIQYGNSDSIATAIVFHTVQNDKPATPGKMQRLITLLRTHSTSTSPLISRAVDLSNRRSRGAAQQPVQ